MQVVEDPSALFDGPCLLAAPHMDDCVLACGGTIAMLPETARIHVVYATDGSRSPVPPLRGAADPRLTRIRTEEARQALGSLGVGADRLHFLALPDGRLRRHAAELTRRLTELLAELGPRQVLVPFRYDRHPDHLAVNRAMHAALARAGSEAVLYEYFVYTEWRLLPRRDVRTYIAAEHLVRIDFAAHAERKRQALGRFRSQTTRWFDWQTRSIITPERIAELCRTPELFLRYDPAFPGPTIFPRRRLWIRLVHWCEPRLKSWKSRLAYMLSRRQ